MLCTGCLRAQRKNTDLFENDNEIRLEVRT